MHLRIVVPVVLAVSLLSVILLAQAPDPPMLPESAFAKVFAMNPRLFGQMYSQRALAAEMADADKASALASFLYHSCGSARNGNELYDKLNAPARALALQTTLDIADATSATLQSRIDEIGRLKSVIEGGP
jgi:hypothetical protein